MSPPNSRLGDYKEFIGKLPMEQPPEIFGFHQNALITKALNDTNNICGALMDCFGTELRLMMVQKQEEAGKDKNRRNSLTEAVNKEADFLIFIDDMISKIPKPFKKKIVMMKYPVLYEESMNTVL